jgi:hypothetical protein
VKNRLRYENPEVVIGENWLDHPGIENVVSAFLVATACYPVAGGRGYLAELWPMGIHRLVAKLSGPGPLQA